jgi:hypothetical protein
VPLGVVDIDGSRVCGAGVSVVVVFGVGVNIGAETAVVGVSFLGVLTAVFSILIPTLKAM